MASAASSEKRVPFAQGRLGDSVIQVLVGTPPVLHHVHKSTICARSPFFASALRGPWLESQSQCVKLPEDDPKIFEIYLRLLYTDKLAVVFSPSDIPPPPPDRSELHACVRAEYNALADLYILCEKLLDVAGKSRIMAGFFEAVKPRADGSKICPSAGQVSRLYDGTPESSPMRRFLVDVFVYNGGSGVAAHVAGGGFPEEFVRDLACALLRGRERPKKGFREARSAKDYGEREGGVEMVDRTKG